MNTFAELANFPVIPFLRDAFWGIICLLLVLIFHGSAINHLYMAFEKRTKHNLGKSQYNRVFFHFYVAFFYIALIHIFGILVWTVFMIALGLIPDPIEALMFAGSCYTTVGFEVNILPVGWKSLAFFVSFTGLFSLAWTTSIMIGMTDTYKNAWNQKYGNTEDVV